MKKLLATAMAVTFVLAGTSGAQANWFGKDKSKDEANARVETRTQAYGDNEHHDFVDAQRNVYGDNRPDTQQNVRVGDKNIHIETPVGYDATARDAEAQKWVYNGSNAYRGGLSGQIAVRDSVNDNDGNAMVVRPVRGAYNQFNASLRQGDMSQSDETRLNHAFNN